MKKWNKTIHISISLLLLSVIITACDNNKSDVTKLGSNVDNISVTEETQMQSTPTLDATPELPTITPTHITATPTITVTNTSIAKSDIIFYMDFEEGDLSELYEKGEFIAQNAGYYSMVTSPVHKGSYAVKLTIDTVNNSGSQASYIFYYEPENPEDSYYYSSWFYIPSDVHPKYWWNLVQWKSTYNGNSDDSVPMWVIGTDGIGEDQKLILMYRPDNDDIKLFYYQDIALLPRDRWFHIETYYKKAYDNQGTVVVWQDGAEIFNMQNVQTVEVDYTLHWSVNNYSDSISPSPCSIYVDDIIVSNVRIGNEY